MKKFILVALLFYGFSTHAQKCGAAFNFQLGYARGSFKNSNPNPIGGGRINFICRPFWQLPLYTGFELGYQRSLSKTNMFEGARLGTYDLYRVKSSSRLASALALVRVSVPSESALLRPFIEALAGANHFSSAILVEKQSGSNFDKVDCTNSGRLGWAMTFGGSAGLNLRMDKGANCYLEIKASYLEGARAKHLTNPTTNGDGTVTFAVEKTETDLFIPQVGLRFNFN